ncbi:MAG: MFS transporter [Phenylobacterium sp.]|uniref:spinster family MFS transporter n=1 Tax=Phenylobacterium sp. TaxID=1871053 RepID=UPI001A31CE4C|nr:MFS transporter [Phenylobacterium sp.]MBJ7408802.1 MFS transporter [Phenylobacterium sp.]
MALADTAVPAANAPAKGRYYVLVLLWLAFTLSILDRYAMGILAEPIKRDLGLSDTMLGVLSGVAFGLFYSTLAVPVARLADRGNRRNLIAGSVFVWSLCTMACGMAANAVQLGLARLCVGIGEAGSTPPAQSMIGDLFEERERGRAVGLFASGANLGLFLAFVVAGLISAAWGWRAAFVALGLPGVVLAAVMVTTLREPARSRPDVAADMPRFADVPRFIVANRALFHIVIGITLSNMATGALVLWLPAYLIRAFTVSSADMGPALGVLFGALGLVGAVGVGWLSDRVCKGDLRRRALLATALPVLMWPCVVGAFLAPSYPVALAFMVVPGLLCTTPTAMTWALMLSIVPERMRATVVAFGVLTANIGALVIGPPLVGWLSDLLSDAEPAAGLRRAMLLFSLTLIASAVCFLLTYRHLRRGAVWDGSERLRGAHAPGPGGS